MPCLAPVGSKGHSREDEEIVHLARNPLPARVPIGPTPKLCVSVCLCVRVCARVEEPQPAMDIHRQATGTRAEDCLGQGAARLSNLFLERGFQQIPPSASCDNST